MGLGQGLTVVTGPNAAGKSNLCQVLSAVSAFLVRYRDSEQREWPAPFASRTDDL